MSIQELTNALGIPGEEQEIADIIISRLDEKYHESWRDKIGNLYVKNKGKNTGKKILLDAHMDEVGVMITHICKDGRLLFTPQGIDEYALLGKSVMIGRDKIKGIACGNEDIKNNPIKYTDMYIDIGCLNKEDAEKVVSVGDQATFNSKYRELENGLIAAKALDDRISCAMILDLLKEKLDIEYIAAFTVREEAGLFGGKASAYHCSPDIVLAFEGTCSADMANVPDEDRVTIVGKGPAFHLRDWFAVHNKDFIGELTALADEKGIPWQYRTDGAGGNNGAVYQQYGNGAKHGMVSVPSKYLHSGFSIASLDDFENLKSLVREFLKKTADEQPIL